MNQDAKLSKKLEKLHKEELLKKQKQEMMLALEKDIEALYPMSEKSLAGLQTILINYPVQTKNPLLKKVLQDFKNATFENYTKRIASLPTVQTMTFVVEDELKNLLAFSEVYALVSVQPSSILKKLDVALSILKNLENSPISLPTVQKMNRLVEKYKNVKEEDSVLNNAVFIRLEETLSVQILPLYEQEIAHFLSDSVIVLEHKRSADCLKDAIAFANRKGIVLPEQEQFALRQKQVHHFVASDITRYHRNKLPALLCYVALILQCLSFVFLYDPVGFTATLQVAIDIVFNILFLLSVFLISEKLKAYKENYGYALMVIGVANFVKFLFLIQPLNNVQLSDNVRIFSWISYSAILVLFVAAGILTVYRSNRLKQHLKQMSLRSGEAV